MTEETLDKKQREIQVLLNLVNALAMAVDMRFMSPEHGSIIWKTHLKESSIDINNKK